MKKHILGALTTIIVSIAISYAYTPTISDYYFVTKLTSVINQILQEKGEYYRSDYVKKLSDIKQRFTANDRITYVLTKTIETISQESPITQDILEKQTAYIKQAYIDPYGDYKVEVDYIQYGPCWQNCAVAEIINNSDKLRTFVVKKTAIIKVLSPNGYIEQEPQHISFERFQNIYNKRDQNGRNSRQDTLFDISISSDGQINIIEEVYRS